MRTAETFIPQNPFNRLRWALIDAWTITQRDLIHWTKQPIQIAINLLFPVLMFVMFGYLIGGAISLPGGGDYRESLIPGMFAMTMIFGIEATFASITTDINRGVTDRFRSMPMAPSAVVTGRCIADMLNSVAGLAVMIACGLLFGWRWHGSFGEAALAVGLLLLLRFALLWVSIYLGLLANNPEMMIAIQILTWPLLFFSNTFVVTETMPGWLGTISEWNPLSATIFATRQLFGNPGGGGESWIAQNALLLAILWPLVLIVIFFPLSVRRYQQLSR